MLGYCGCLLCYILLLLCLGVCFAIVTAVVGLTVLVVIYGLLCVWIWLYVCWFRGLFVNVLVTGWCLFWWFVLSSGCWLVLLYVLVAWLLVLGYCGCWSFNSVVMSVSFVYYSLHVLVTFVLC